MPGPRAASWIGTSIAPAPRIPNARVEELRARGHHHRDAIARLDPELLQAGGEAARAVRELRVAERLAVHQRELTIAVALRLGRHKLG